ncbi:MAG: hypothetical protein PHS17_06675 [Desulfobacterales bacterium]|nr:hypothetical protein [Desulfobacterales bacterium]
MKVVDGSSHEHKFKIEGVSSGALISSNRTHKSPEGCAEGAAKDPALVRRKDREGRHLNGKTKPLYRKDLLHV